MNYLPNCICNRVGICPIHGPLERGRTMKRAARAVKSGHVSLSDYQRWKARHSRETKKPLFNKFGS